jgi:uncharacterized protein YcbX
MPVVIQSLHVYPVKSLRGITLDRASLTPLGLAHDRAWLVLDGDDRFLSQRRVPAMATVTTSLSDQGLRLEAAGLPSLDVPLTPPDGPRRSTTVWDDPCEVVDEGDEAARWLAAVLGKAFSPRLVRMAPGYRRPQPRPDRYGADTAVQFADTAPLLVTSTASLEALNDHLARGGHDPVPMDRFRANVVVTGLDAFEEHGIEALEGPSYRLGLRYPRERCVMVTMDQATGARDPSSEPFRTLRRLNPMPGKPGPAFGQLAIVEAGDGATVVVGDQLTARSR